MKDEIIFSKNPILIPSLIEREKMKKFLKNYKREKNKETRPFEEYKEMIQDMSKDNMIKGLYDLSANIIEKDKEIERLNNIIEELNNKITKLELKELTYLDIINKRSKNFNGRFTSTDFIEKED